MKTTYLITSDCRFEGNVLKKGSEINLDPEDPREGQKVALLARAGRICDATRENRENLKAEIKLEADREKLARAGGMALAAA